MEKEFIEGYMQLLGVHKNLKVAHIFIYAMIVEDCKKYGKCNLTNSEFAKILGVKYNAITILLNGLIAYKLIKRIGVSRNRYLVLN
jgi:hypothetical protein